MTVVATYQIDINMYCDANTKHNLSSTTTEYICRNDVLLHLQMGKNLGLRLNNMSRINLREACTNMEH